MTLTCGKQAGDEPCNHGREHGAAHVEHDADGNQDAEGPVERSGQGVPHRLDAQGGAGQEHSKDDDCGEGPGITEEPQSEVAAGKTEQACARDGDKERRPVVSDALARKGELRALPAVHPPAL